MIKNRKRFRMLNPLFSVCFFKNFKKLTEIRPIVVFRQILSRYLLKTRIKIRSTYSNS